MAVWELLDRYSKNIMRVVRRHLPAELQSKVDASDIVQSVWKSLLRRPAAVEGASGDQFLAYLAGMARLKVYETHRHYTRRAAVDIRREQPTDGPAGAAGRRPGLAEPNGLRDHKARAPSSIAALRENWTLALDKAGERGQQVIDLKLQGLSLNEIAERLAIGKSTVQRILRSLLTSLSA
jgi:RNA polymerase sigma factor (sigma-70 family)